MNIYVCMYVGVICANITDFLRLGHYVHNIFVSVKLPMPIVTINYVCVLTYVCILILGIT